jgi:carbon monoxide dehydrogenase subunit G
MANYSTSVDSPKSAEEVFKYMADFRNAEEWDANTSSVKLIAGEAGEVGSRYEVITGFGGRDLKMEYETVSVDEPSQVVFESSTGMAKIRDTIDVTADGTGSRLDYDARIMTSGLGKLLDPVFSLIFKRVGDRAAESLRKALAG